jgi:glycosyltransferase involved in cell wall biosynthesis
MRVAHFIDSLDPGGAESIVLEICSRLPQHGYTAEVVHFGNRWIEEGCKRYGLASALAPAYADFKSVLRLPWFALSFGRFLRARGVQLLHAHLYGAIVGGSLGARVAGIPCVGTVHDQYTLLERRSRAAWLRRLSWLGLRLVSVSRTLEDDLRDRAAFGEGALRTIVNGIDVERFSGPRDPACRATLGIEEDDVGLISVGRLVTVKGYDMLLRAVARLAPRPRVVLVLVGDGPEWRALEALRDDLGLGDRVRFAGFRDDVPAILASGDCFALASRSEGLSCSIAEALASGLPAVVTDVGGNRELVEHGRTGFVVPAGDVGAFAEQLQRVAADPELRVALGRRAREQARERLSAPRMVGDYVRLYQELGCQAGRSDG